MHRLLFFTALAAISLILQAPAFAQNKIARSVTNEMLEKVLQGLELKTQKGERKDKDNVTVYYDFKRGEQSFRLYNYVNDLWIECVFEKQLKIEEVNLWNASAKFSRLVLIESKDKTTLSLESQIDCLGGVTEVGIRQFINRFEDESKKFGKFLAK